MGLGFQGINIRSITVLLKFFVGDVQSFVWFQFQLKFVKFQSLIGQFKNTLKVIIIKTYIHLYNAVLLSCKEE